MTKGGTAPHPTPTEGKDETQKQPHVHPNPPTFGKQSHKKPEVNLGTNPLRHVGLGVGVPVHRDCKPWNLLSIT